MQFLDFTGVCTKAFLSTSSKEPTWQSRQTVPAAPAFSLRLAGGGVVLRAGVFAAAGVLAAAGALAAAAARPGAKRAASATARIWVLERMVVVPLLLLGQVASVALARREGRMLVGLEELGVLRRVRVVATDAVDPRRVDGEVGGRELLGLGVVALAAQIVHRLRHEPRLGRGVRLVAGEAVVGRLVSLLARKLDL